MYRNLNDEDPDSHLVGDEVLSITASNKSFFVGASGTNTVTEYTFEDPSVSKGVLARFTADATSLDVDAEGTTLAAGSADMTLKVIDVATYNITEFTGHEAPILCTVLDTNNAKEFLLSSSCDGSVKVWNIKSGSVIKTLDGLFPKSSDVSTSKTPVKIAWHPEGRFFAVPIQSGIKIFSRDSWDESKELKPDFSLGQDELFSAVCWLSLIHI